MKPILKYTEIWYRQPKVKLGMWSQVHSNQYYTFTKGIRKQEEFLVFIYKLNDNHLYSASRNMRLFAGEGSPYIEIIEVVGFCSVILYETSQNTINAHYPISSISFDIL